MRNYISVNAKYYKASHISKIYKHNQRKAYIDYLLNEEDRVFKNDTYSTNKNLTLEEHFKDQFNKKCADQKAHNYHQPKTGNENEIIEMVVSLSEEQALYYLKKPNGEDMLMNGYIQFLKSVEDEYGFKGLDINLHTDEGYYDTKGNVKYNIHAHITFLNYDFNKSKTVLRSLKKSDWSYMQDIASQSFKTHNLDFIRGEQKLVNIKDHLERNDFILQKQQFEIQDQIYELELNKQYLDQQIKTLNQNKNTLKEQLQQFNRKSKEYKELTPKVEQAQQDEQTLREERKKLKKEINTLKEKQEAQLQKADIEQNNINKNIAKLQNEEKQLNNAIKYQTNRLDQLHNEKDSTEQLNSKLEEHNQKLETKINTTKEKSLTAINKSVHIIEQAKKQDTITFKKTIQKELAKHNNYNLELQENTQLKEKLKTIQAEKKQIAKDSKKLIEQNKQLQKTNKTLKEDNKKLEDENGDLRLKNLHQTYKITAQKNYIDNLKEIIKNISGFTSNSLAKIFNKFLPHKEIDLTQIDE